MHNNAVAGVTLASEITNATVHAITRENSECAVIRFIATSNWKAGDTATVDGVPVTALLPSGETLPDGAYVINANVLCILTGTNLTVYLGSKKAENANEISFNDTTVGAELVRLDGEVVKLNENLDNVNTNLEWKLAGSSAGTNVISLPASYNELMIEVQGPTSAGYGYTFSILKQMLTNTEKRFFNGFYHRTEASGSESYGAVKLNVSLTTVKLGEFYNGNSKLTGSSTTYVYYR